ARRLANPLSGLSRWKILDNLRRSLVPVALVLLLLGAWLVLPTMAALATVLVLTVVAVPGLLPAGYAIFRRPADLPWSMHLRTTLAACARQLGQVLLSLAFLPYDAFVSVDAVGRTLLRLLVTRRRLLEWQTSHDTERTSRSTPGSFFSAMWIAPAVAVGAGLGVAWLQPSQLPLVLPLLALWLGSPWVAWWISQPIAPPDTGLSATQMAFLGRTS